VNLKFILTTDRRWCPYPFLVQVLLNIQSHSEQGCRVSAHEHGSPRDQVIPSPVSVTMDCSHSSSTTCCSHMSYALSAHPWSYLDQLSSATRDISRGHAYVIISENAVFLMWENAKVGSQACFYFIWWSRISRL
jgi:hypothetical protein